MVLAAVHIDVPEGRVVALQIKAAYKPLFGAWLDNKEPQQVALQFDDIVLGDPEGIGVGNR